jgi:hypothetical protein
MITENTSWNVYKIVLNYFVELYFLKKTSLEGR